MDLQGLPPTAQQEVMSCLQTDQHYLFFYFPSLLGTCTFWRTAFEAWFRVNAFEVLVPRQRFERD